MRKERLAKTWEVRESEKLRTMFPPQTQAQSFLWSSAERCLTPLIALQNVAEAQCIANQVQLFYATDRKEIFGLVETFNFRPNEFKYMSVIAELEQSGLGAELKCAQNQDKT